MLRDVGSTHMCVCVCVQYRCKFVVRVGNCVPTCVCARVCVCAFVHIARHQNYDKHFSYHSDVKGVSAGGNGGIQVLPSRLVNHFVICGMPKEPKVQVSMCVAC